MILHYHTISCISRSKFKCVSKFSIHRTELENSKSQCIYFSHSPLLRSELESYTSCKSLPCNQDRVFCTWRALKENAMLMRKQTKKTNINLVTSDNSHAPLRILSVAKRGMPGRTLCDIKRESYPRRVGTGGNPAVSLARKVHCEERV